MSRDNARTPMQWDDSENAGFSTATPWLPVNPNSEMVNAAAEIDDPDSVFSHYRALIALRHNEPTVAYGDFTMLLPDHDTIYAFIRAYESTRLLVLANFSSEPVGFSNLSGAGLEEWKDAELVLRNYPAVGDVPGAASRVGGPGAARFRKRRITCIMPMGGRSALCASRSSGPSQHRPGCALSLDLACEGVQLGGNHLTR